MFSYDSAFKNFFKTEEKTFFLLKTQQNNWIRHVTLIQLLQPQEPLFLSEVSNDTRCHSVCTGSSSTESLIRKTQSGGIPYEK